MGIRTSPILRQLRPGDVLDGRYRIEGQIGAGGMSDVFGASRTRLGDIVALKVLHVASRGSEVLDQFLKEARISAMLRHPHIVSVLDFGIESAVGPYLVTEYLNGSSLREQLAERGSFEVEEVRRIASQVAGGLNLAHSQGVIHRDVKPANLMTHRYTSGEVVYKVIDFGIGALQTGHDPATLDGRVFLTPAYASPEQLSGRPADARSDIYSFGVAVYELLAGRRPFVESESASIIDLHLNAAPPSLQTLRQDIPAAVDAAVLKALAKDPQSRWQTATEFAEALSGASHRSRAVVRIPASRLAEEYQLGPVIGRGRLGSRIHEATQRATGHPVAIRVLRRTKAATWDAARSRFMREARMTPVNHPSVLRVRDFGEEADFVFVVTDRAPGLSLRQALDSDGPFSWSRGRRLFLDLIEATRALHAHGLLLFGVTPSIIRIAADADRERLVVSSAGIVDVEEVIGPTSVARRLDAETAYLAPELLIGESPDGRSDIFTIGVIGYEMFTGRRPFAARTLRQLIAAVFAGDIADPRELAPSLPEAAARCLLRSLARRPDERFSDVIELGTVSATIA